MTFKIEACWLQLDPETWLWRIRGGGGGYGTLYNYCKVEASKADIKVGGYANHAFINSSGLMPKNRDFFQS